MQDAFIGALYPPLQRARLQVPAKYYKKAKKILSQEVTDLPDSAPAEESYPAESPEADAPEIEELPMAYGN